MRIILMFSVVCLWVAVACAQSLYRPIILSYSGANIESYRLMYGSPLPYDGIGKRVLMEQIPEMWYRRLGRSVQPSGVNYDAFGAILPTNEGVYWRTRLAVMTDQFGNVGLDVKNSYNFWVLRFRSAAFAQFRRPTFSRMSNKQDYYTSKKFNWHMQVDGSETVYEWNSRFEYGGTAFVLYSDECAGQKGYKRDYRDSIWGFATKALQVNAAAYGKWVINDNMSNTRFKHHIGGLLDYKHHQQEQLLTGSKTYEGKENINTLSLYYQLESMRNQGGDNLHVNLLMGRDTTTERVDTFVRQTDDRYFLARIYGVRHYREWGHMKGGANIEKHSGQKWQFLPKCEFDFSLPKSWALSVFGSTGMRQVKPICFFYHWMALAEGVRFEAQPYEFSRRAGVSIAKRNEKTVSLSLDITQFDNKLIIRKDETNKLFFSTFDRPLRRFTADFNFYTPLGKKHFYWGLYGQYRYEHFSADNPMTYQNAHQVQTQLQYARGAIWSRIEYAIRLPQHYSKPFQRLDYKITYTPFIKKHHAMQSLSFSLCADNVQQWLLPRPLSASNLPPILLEEDLNLWQMPNIRLVANVPLH